MTQPQIDLLFSSEGHEKKLLPLAQYYRPRFFFQVVGQDIFVTLIRNALAQNRLSHGLLLTGIRGIGKTTLARLVAKALCCANRDETQEPCDKCPSCVAFSNESHLDVVEIDAASHTGVDDIRAIIDSCVYRPLMGPYKIFIIDEVHMLSKSAFNALLKTLEEPPPHVKFIFATTEVGKIPVTILSRCQQFSLRRLDSETMARHLRYVINHQGFSASDLLVDALVHYSEGSARDALSLLERVMMAYDRGGTPGTPNSLPTLSLSLLHSVLGLPSAEGAFHLLAAIGSGDSAQVTHWSQTLYRCGCEPEGILKELMRCIYSLLQDMTSKKIYARREIPSPEEGGDSAPPSSSLGANDFSEKIPDFPPELFSVSRLDRLWQLTEKGLKEVRSSPFPFLSLDFVLRRLTYGALLPTPQEVLGALSWPDQRAQSCNAPQTLCEEALTQVPTCPSHESSPPNVIGEAGGLEAFLLFLQNRREALLYAQCFQNLSWEDGDGVTLLFWQEGPQGNPPEAIKKPLENFLKDFFQNSQSFSWNPHATALTMGQKEKILQEEKYAQLNASPVMEAINAAFPQRIIETIETV